MSKRPILLTATVMLTGWLAATPAPAAVLGWLAAAGPEPSHRAQLMDFGRFVGQWRMAIEIMGPDGQVQKRKTGFWEFGWVLEGRAVQDVFILPADTGQPGTGEAGTTLRFYDPGADRWRITYLGVRHALDIDFAAHREGEAVVLERTEDNHDLTHWVFDQVRPDSFRWRALTSTDGGAHWRVDEVMMGTRLAEPMPTPPAEQPVSSAGR